MVSDTDTKQERIQKICQFAIAIGQCYAVVRRDTISQIDITRVVEPTHGKRLLTQPEFDNFWATRMNPTQIQDRWQQLVWMKQIQHLKVNTILAQINDLQ